MILRILGIMLSTVLVAVGGSNPGPSLDGSDSAPIRIVALGDSISVPCTQTPPSGWCGTLDSLLTQADVPHVIIGRAVGGVNCGYWSSQIQSVLEDTRPDLLLVYCGTNNDGLSVAGTNAMGEQWRTIVEAAHNFGAKVGVSFIGYSNQRIQDEQGRSWLLPSEGGVNDEIFRNLQYYWNAGWLAGLADIQQLPGNLDYLNPSPDGIHPNDLGSKAIGTIWYIALRNGTVQGTAMPWPNIASTPCGMWGGRLPYQPPSFIPCVSLT